ncbi:hypothetical protein EV567_3313 [Streptomyces sp. BK239]|nr:hypothetical protein EV567_3313 [Streptomyces sp. BK239]
MERVRVSVCAAGLVLVLGGLLAGCSSDEYHDERVRRRVCRARARSRVRGPAGRQSSLWTFVLEAWARGRRTRRSTLT